MSSRDRIKKLKVLNVLTTIQDGGMETLVFRIYKGLSFYSEFNFNVCSLLKVEKNFLIDNFRKLGCNVVEFDFKNKNLTFKEYLKLIKNIFKLSRYFAVNKFDVINSHDFYSATITRIALILSFLTRFYRPAKSFVTLHNLFFWLNTGEHLINRLMSFTTTSIICVSKSVYEYSRKNDRISNRKYKIIYNGIDVHEFTPDETLNIKYRNLLGLKQESIIIGNIGTYSIRKGQKYLVNSFLKLLSRHPNLVLIIFGSKRNHEVKILDEINEIIDKNGLSGSVILYDTRDDIKNIYNVFDIFVMPSISEGFSLAALEAMLMKRICIFSDIGPFKELVDDGINGFLFKSKDTLSLAEKLEYTISNLTSLNNIRENARETVLRKFAYETMIKNYYDTYKL